MRVSIQIVFAAGALLMASSWVHAQGVTLRCGGGTVQTNGFYINQAGEVVFSEPSIACNVQQSGTTLPDALVLGISAPAVGTTIDVGTSAQNVTFTASIQNYDAQFDTCQVRVQPPGGAAWAARSLVPNAAGVASVNETFAQGLTGGSYSFQLSCVRQANNQQIVVPQVARSITVNSSAPTPVGCADDPIPSIFNPVFQRNFTDTYLSGGGQPSGFGALPNESTNWRDWTFRNEFSSGTPTSMTLRTWKFRPSADARVELRPGNTGLTQMVVSISECPGKFANLGRCARPSGSMYWSTKPGDSPNSWCKLDPTKDYYINAATFDLDLLNANGQYNGNSCVGTGCFIEQPWQVKNSPY